MSITRRKLLDPICDKAISATISYPYFESTHAECESILYKNLDRFDHRDKPEHFAMEQIIGDALNTIFLADVVQ